MYNYLIVLFYYFEVGLYIFIVFKNKNYILRVLCIKLVTTVLIINVH